MRNRYAPHNFNLRIQAVKFYRDNHTVKETCQKFKVSKASLLRWAKRYDGTDKSLMDKSRVGKQYSLDTRYNAVTLCNTHEYPVVAVAEFYGITTSTLYRWLEMFDGTIESLKDDNMERS